MKKSQPTYRAGDVVEMVDPGSNGYYPPLGTIGIVVSEYKHTTIGVRFEGCDVHSIFPSRVRLLRKVTHMTDTASYYSQLMDAADGL